VPQDINNVSQVAMIAAVSKKSSYSKLSVLELSDKLDSINFLLPGRQGSEVSWASVALKPSKPLLDNGHAQRKITGARKPQHNPKLKLALQASKINLGISMPASYSRKLMKPWFVTIQWPMR